MECSWLAHTVLCVRVLCVCVQRVFRIPDLWVRPSLGGKGRKMPGTLEAHQNGFR
jgi:nucleosome binding factor SPN SPT16 subunit